MPIRPTSHETSSVQESSANSQPGASMPNSDARGSLQGREIAGTPNNAHQAGQISQLSGPVFGSPEAPL